MALSGTELLTVVPLRSDGTPGPLLLQTTTQAIANLFGGGASQSANLFWASPASGNGAAAFRAIASADLASALASPPAIGGTTPGAITATTFHATQNSSFAGSLTAGNLTSFGFFTASGLVTAGSFQIGGFNAGGLVSVSGGMTFTGSAHPQAQFGGTMSGSAANNASTLSTFLLGINADTVASPFGVNWFNVTSSFGGSAMTGNRTAIASFANLTAPTGNAALGNLGVYYVSYASVMQASSGDGGTSGNLFGNLFGLNPTVRLNAGATFFNTIIAAEFDLNMQAGSSVGYRQGIKVVLGGTGGTVLNEDFAIGINSSSPAGNYLAFANGFVFGSAQGWWPIQPTGTMIGTISTVIQGGGPAYAAAFGIDFSAVTFSTAFLKSVGVLVDGSGNGTFASLIIGTAGPTLTGGSAAPSSTQPAGSIYMRSGGASGARVYVSAGSGTWNPISGV